MKVMIPRIRQPKAPNLFAWKLISAILINGVIIVCLRFVLALLKFNSECWQSMNIFRALLGLSFTNEPKRNKERIVFICLLFTFMVYSGFLYSMLTDIELHQSPEIEINTIEDLANSNFTLWTVAKVLLDKSLFITESSSFQKLAQRSHRYIRGEYSHRHCLNDLAKFKNVSCSLASQMVSKEIDFLTKKNENLDVKILEEVLTYYAAAFKLSPGSPFIDNFNELLVKFVDAGLMSKWNFYASRSSGNPTLRKSKENQSNGLLQRLLLFLGCGYILATTAFVVELLCSVKMRRKAYLYRRRIIQLFVK